MPKKIEVEVLPFSGVRIDGMRILRNEIESVIEQYKELDFTFVLRPYCNLVSDTTMKNVKKIFREKGVTWKTKKIQGT